MKTNKIIVALMASFFLQSCAHEDTLRTEGLTLGAGDAMARNSALQIIDPWPAGVEDTDLVVPNKRPNKKVEGGDDTAVKQPVTTTP